MKKSSKIIALIITLVMCLGLLVACNDKTTNEGPANTVNSPPPPPSTNANTAPPVNAPAAPEDPSEREDFVALAPAAQAGYMAMEDLIREMHAGAVSSKDTMTFASVVDPGAVMSLLEHTTMPLSSEAQERFIQWNYATMSFYSPLMTSWEVDPDYMGVTFHLKPNVKMHCGKTMGPDDIIMSVEAFRTHNASRSQLDFLDMDNVTIFDDTTMHIPFTRFNAVWESAFTMFTVFCADCYEEAGRDISFYQRPCGPSAYMITEWIPGERIVLTRNENYHLGTPPIRQIIMRIISDRTAAFMALLNGEIDLFWSISADQVQTIYNRDDLKSVITGRNMMIYLGMNSANNALSDVRVRQAIYYALNRDDIIQGAYNGFASPTYSILSPESLGFDPAFEQNNPFPQRDVERAKALLAEAGYPNGLTLRLLAESTINFQIATEQIVMQLAEAGITVDPTLTDSGSMNAVLFAAEPTGYDLYLHLAQVAGDSVSFLDNPRLFGATNPGLSPEGAGWFEIINRINTTPDIEERSQLYRDLHTYFFEHGYFWYPIALSQTYVGMNSDLTGIYRLGIVLFFNQAYFK